MREEKAVTVDGEEKETSALPGQPEHEESAGGGAGHRGLPLIVAGTICLLLAFFLAGYNLWEDYLGGRSSDAAAELLTAQMGEGDGIYNDPDREMPVIEIDGYEYVGLLLIPDLNRVLPVMAQCDEERLKIAPCRYSGSIYKDNMVIAGHNYRSHFSPVKWLPLGSTIAFRDVEGNVYTYEITAFETILPEEIEEMTEGEDWDLTLFTCTTGGGKRCAIRCRRAEAEE